MSIGEGTGEVAIVFWRGALTEREHLEDLVVDNDNIKTDLQ